MSELYVNRFGSLCENYTSQFGAIKKVIAGVVNPYFPKLEIIQAKNYFFSSLINAIK